jgi:hypothetical protein
LYVNICLYDVKHNKRYSNVFISDAPITHSSKKFGYLEEKHHRTVLKLDIDDDTEQKHILCETGKSLNIINVIKSVERLNKLILMESYHIRYALMW